MSLAIISMGTNMGDRRDVLSQALQRLSFSSQIKAVSDVYETFGAYEKRDPYLNFCVQIETDMTSFQLIQYLIETERQLGRNSEHSREDLMPLDCDLISFDQEVIRTPLLTLPHPEAHRRPFVMIPLAQIDPTWMHPLLHKTAEELAKESYWSGWGTFFTNGKSLLDF